MLMLCCIGAVMLTMHHRPPLILMLRPALLAFTDGLPIVFWVYVLHSLTKFDHYLRTHSWLIGIAALYLLCHIYFFVVLQGRGIAHDVLHAFSGFAVLHTMYLSVASWSDDLVDTRRRKRGLFLIAACMLMMLYVISELSGSRFMRSEIGSLLGAALMLLLSLCFGVYCFLYPVGTHPNPHSVAELAVQTTNRNALSQEQTALLQRLETFIQEQGFTQSNLTLNRLAALLGTKQYLLRNLINQSLGYRNFSSYLNDQRLPLACDWLLNKPNLPVTDIALDLGYGSITSFNRAFKARYNKTPSEYRSVASPIK